jgi:hypothetical protein
VAWGILIYKVLPLPGEETLPALDPGSPSIGDLRVTSSKMTVKMMQQVWTPQTSKSELKGAAVSASFCLKKEPIISLILMWHLIISKGKT